MNYFGKVIFLILLRGAFGSSSSTSPADAATIFFSFEGETWREVGFFGKDGGEGLPVARFVWLVGKFVQSRGRAEWKIFYLFSSCVSITIFETAAKVLTADQQHVYTLASLVLMY